jgi:large subunit ribosomal protein L10
MAKTKRPPQTRKKLGGPRMGEGGPRRDKANAVDEIQTKLSGSSAVLLSEYRGMTVHELAELRTTLRQADAEYKVYKNTLATVAARNVGLDYLTTHFEGPTAFTFTTGDPVVAAKRLTEFAKKVPTLVLKGGVLDGKVLDVAAVTRLGNLESREVMLAKAAGMFITPLQQAANLFAAGFNQLGAVLVQLRDKLPGDAATGQTENTEG